VVQIKDLIEGKRQSEGIHDNTTWRASRPAQVIISESELVEKVKAMLAAIASDGRGGE
jgi:histidyl-tRNA synthetase